jgi:hypothetical protein
MNSCPVVGLGYRVTPSSTPEDCPSLLSLAQPGAGGSFHQRPVLGGSCHLYNTIQAEEKAEEEKSEIIQIFSEAGVFHALA